MSVTGDFWSYSSERLVPLDRAPDFELSVADSFLLHKGSVRSLAAHFARFEASITDEVSISQLPGFFGAVRNSLPLEGDWFPRIEYRASAPVGERLFLQVRNAPEQTETATLWSNPDPDPRVNPKVKGPDLAIGMQLRRTANLHGADEAVLLDSNGFIADGALSAIMWWRDGVLMGPDENTNWLPSVTREEAQNLAIQAGFEIGEEKCKPEDLVGLEVWNLSSTQGIRGVTKWGDIPIAAPKLFHSFRKRHTLIYAPVREIAE
jgi:branched-subunit amino acid aminotransferase/4-amino-4-deoxychorismate lyase